MKFRNVLVTGGAGFIGSQLVRDLLARNYRVTVLDDLSTGRKENLAECLSSKDLNLHIGSICNRSDVAKALEGCDSVLHLAVSNLRVSIRNPSLSHEVNASGTFNVLEACRQRSIQRFVYVSSSEVYGTAMQVPMTESHPTRPSTVYASSKLAGEYYTLSFGKMYGMDVTVLRPFNNYGPRSHFERENGEIIPRSVIRALNGQPPMLFGNGQQTRDFIYVADTTRAMIQAFESEETRGEIFNIAYGKEITMDALTRRICALVNPRLEPKYMDVNRPGDVLRHFASNGKLLALTGMEPPRINIDAGLKLYLEWFKQQNYDLKSLMDEVVDQNW